MSDPKVLSEEELGEIRAQYKRAMDGCLEYDDDPKDSLTAPVFMTVRGKHLARLLATIDALKARIEYLEDELSQCEICDRPLLVSKEKAAQMEAEDPDTARASGSVEVLICGHCWNKVCAERDKLKSWAEHQELTSKQAIDALKAENESAKDQLGRAISAVKDLERERDDALKDLDDALDACEAQLGAEAHLPNANAAPPIRQILRKFGRLPEKE